MSTQALSIGKHNCIVLNEIFTCPPNTICVFTKPTDSNLPLNRIRVKNFARQSQIGRPENSPDKNEPASLVVDVPQLLEAAPDIDVISLSSEEEVKPAIKAKAKSRRKIGRINGKLSKAPLVYKYHTIDEYFQKRKIERKYICN